MSACQTQFDSTFQALIDSAGKYSSQLTLQRYVPCYDTYTIQSHRHRRLSTSRFSHEDTSVTEQPRALCRPKEATGSVSSYTAPLNVEFTLALVKQRAVGQ